jgi:hypothetical protein
MTELSDAARDKIEAAAFRRLLAHLQANPDVANIDLMITADFCRNCLADWYMEAAADAGVEVSKDEAREHTHGMPYAEWKASQPEATPEQLAAFKARKAKA